MHFQCTILVHEMYKLQMNKIYTIFITKSWYVKFVMYMVIFNDIILVKMKLLKWSETISLWKSCNDFDWWIAPHFCTNANIIF
jgi:hypothetical protein